MLTGKLIVNLLMYTFYTPTLEISSEKSSLRYIYRFSIQPMKRVITLLITCSSFFTVAASTQMPYLTQEQLIEVLVDLELTQVMVQQDTSHDPQLAQTVFQEQAELIFKSHAIDQNLFQQSYFQYLTDPKQFKVLQEKLITQLEKLLQEAAEKR